MDPYYYHNHEFDNELLHLLCYLRFIRKYDDLTTLDHRQWKKHRNLNKDNYNFGN